MNQFAFYINDCINRHNIRVANATRIVNFDILRNDENDIDSNSNSLQIEISIKRVLENIIVTINNQLAKKKRKRLKNPKNIARFDALSRVDFNVLSYIFRRFVSVIFFFETLNAFLNESLNEMLRERRERNKLRKNKKSKIMMMLLMSIII